MSDKDIVAELRGRAGQEGVDADLLTRAADTIERLCALAGVVSAGDGSFRAIAEQLVAARAEKPKAEQRYSGL